MITIRQLTPDDAHHIDHITTLLAHLTQAPTLTIPQAKTIIETMIAQNTASFLACDDDKIVGIISVMIEQKLIRGGARCAHLEDLVVDPAFQGQGIGQKLIDHATNYARSQNAYKIILDCEPAMVSRYQRQGFGDYGTCMRKNNPHG